MKMKIHKKIYPYFAATVILSLTGCSTVSNTTISELVAPGLAISGATLGALGAKEESEGTRPGSEGRIELCSIGPGEADISKPS